MRAVQRDVLRDEIAVGDEVVLLGGDGTEVVVDRRQDVAQARAALRACGVVHHVLGDEVVEHARRRPPVAVGRTRRPRSRVVALGSHGSQTAQGFELIADAMGNGLAARCVGDRMTTLGIIGAGHIGEQRREGGARPRLRRGDQQLGVVPTRSVTSWPSSAPEPGLPPPRMRHAQRRSGGGGNPVEELPAASPP